MGNQIVITCYSEVIDNSGRTSSSKNPIKIKNALKEMTDDMIFKGIDENGNKTVFSPDDLENKTVYVDGKKVVAESDFG